MYFGLELLTNLRDGTREVRSHRRAIRNSTNGQLQHALGVCHVSALKEGYPNTDIQFSGLQAAGIADTLVPEISLPFSFFSHPSVAISPSSPNIFFRVEISFKGRCGSDESVMEKQIIV